MKEDTIIYEYSLFPEHLGQTTFGELKKTIIEKGGDESILKKLTELLLKSGKGFVYISFPSPKGHIYFSTGYRLKKFSWWERNFTLIDPM